MKKLFALLLSMIMVFALFPCGGETFANAESAATAVEPEDRVIEIDPVYVAVDDENVKIEIPSVSCKVYNAGTKNEFVEYRVDLIITNKSSEYEVQASVATGAAFIGPYTVNFANSTTNAKAGKINDMAAYTCTVYPNDHDRDTAGADHITSLEDLLLFNAEVRISQKFNDGNSIQTKKNYIVNISLEDALKGNAEETETEAVTPDDAPVADETPAAAGTVLECPNATILGMYVDKSYQDKHSDSMKLVYLFYTVKVTDDNLKVHGKATTITINGKNSYKAEHIARAGRMMENFYYSNYIKTLYIGDEVMVLETFLIPIGEFGEGRSIVFSNSNIPGFGTLSMMSDDVIICETRDESAQTMDPEGYAAEAKRNEKVSDKERDKVRKGLNGYYWEFYVNGISYKLEFFKSHSFELRAPGYGIRSEGKYTVRKGYVILKYDNGMQVEIPYTRSGSDVTLDVLTAFDVNCD